MSPTNLYSGWAFTKGGSCGGYYWFTACQILLKIYHEITVGAPLGAVGRERVFLVLILKKLFQNRLIHFRQLICGFYEEFSREHARFWQTALRGPKVIQLQKFPKSDRPLFNRISSSVRIVFSPTRFLFLSLSFSSSFFCFVCFERGTCCRHHPLEVLNIYWATIYQKSPPLEDLLDNTCLLG